jgi:dihydropteroate synthase
MYVNLCIYIADSLMPRWMQLIDPGIGFAKVEKENLAIMKGENMRSFFSIVNLIKL